MTIFIKKPQTINTAPEATRPPSHNLISSISCNPEIAVSPTSVSFTNVEGSQTFQITSNADWKIEVEYSVGDEWLTVTPMSGSGDATVSLSVPTNDTGAVRSAVVKCIAMHPQYGNWDTKRVSVSQSANDKPVGPSGDVLYSDNFDGQVAEQTWGSNNSWPYMDQFPEFANPKGPAGANVTYTGTNISIRANSPSNNNYSQYKDQASGNNNIFFGKAGNMFVINGIELAADKSNLQLTFGRYRSLYGAEDNTFVTSEFHIYLSKNGTAWEEISYETPVDAASSYGTWNTATADFTLTEVPEKLYIKFTSDLASSHRIDDVTLSTGNGGQSVTLPEGGTVDPVKEGTIEAAIATADGSEAAVAEATVIGIYNKGFLIGDATGKILVYTNEAATVTVGEKVKVEGTVTSYGGLKQFAAVKDSSGAYGPAPVVTSLGAGTFTQPAPEKLDGAGMDAYLSAPVVKYIEYTGTLSISGNYYNVTVEGASKAIGSISYPVEGMVDASLNGTVITVRGYAIGVSSSKYVNTMLVELVGSSEPMLKVDPASLSFSADGGSKEITATLLNSTDAITASSDNAQFTVAVAANVITVTAAANTSAEAVNGTITVKAGSLEKTVAVLQSGKSTGDEKTLTFKFSDVLAANADLPTNGYGSQNVTTESTWISWTIDNVLFKGAKICQANSDNAGYMQMQGNGSDAAKQGFLGNADAIPGTIKKIEVKCFNTKYSPNFNIYLGSSAFPTTNGINAEGNSDEGVADSAGKGKIYTSTFEIGGSYNYFALRNDTQGAFYFDSITIYYQ